MCKFTPLGFETTQINKNIKARKRVNLPRWGLKLLFEKSRRLFYACKFTPLGFETA